MGCAKDDQSIDPFDSCKATTRLNASIISENDTLCWNDEPPYRFYQSSSSTCGEGYDWVKHQWIAMEFNIGERDPQIENISDLKRSFTIGIPFLCDDYSTQEKFGNILTIGTYEFTDEEYIYDYDFDDFGKFYIRYQEYDYDKDEIVYLNTVYGQQIDSYLEIVKIEIIEPDWHGDPNDENSYGSPMKLYITIQGKFKLYDNGGILRKEIKKFNSDIELSRQAPIDYKWDDWGKEFE